MEETCSNATENGTHEMENNDIEWVAIKDIFSSLKPISTPIQKTTHEICLVFTAVPTSQDELHSFDVICCKVLDATNLIQKLPTQKPVSKEIEPLNSWTTTVTIQGIINNHLFIQDLVSNCSEIQDCESFPILPKFNTPPTGVWAYISGEKYDPTLNCRLVENYFKQIYDYCGEELLIEVFFAQSSGDDQNCENSFAKYEECFSELNRNSYQTKIKECREFYASLNESKLTKDIRTMDDLFDYYAQSDDAEYSLVKAINELYQFEIQPFYDNHRISVKDREELRKQLTDANIATKMDETTFLDKCKQEKAAQEQVLNSNARLHELKIYHLRELSQITESRLQETKLDKETFGLSKWTPTLEFRLQKLAASLNDQLVKLLTIQIECLQDAKEKTILDIVALEETMDFSLQLKKKECIVFTIENQLIDMKIRLIDEKEILLRHNIAMLYRDDKDRENMSKQLEKLVAKKSVLRTRQRIVRTAQQQADLSLKNESENITDSNNKNIEIALGESFYSEIVLEKRKSADFIIASIKHEKIRNDRIKVMERVKKRIAETPKPEKQPLSYLPSNKQRSQLERSNFQVQQSISNTSSRSSVNSVKSKLVKPTATLTLASTTTRKLQPRVNRTTPKQKNVASGSAQNSSLKINQKVSESNKTQSNISTEAKKAEIPPPPPPNIPDPPPNMPVTSEVTPVANLINKSPVKTKKNEKESKRGVTLNEIVEARNKLKNITDENSTMTANTQGTLTKMIRGGVNIRSSKNNSESKNNIDYKAASLSNNAAAILSKHLNSINMCTQDSDSDTNSPVEEDPDKWD